MKNFSALIFAFIFLSCDQNNLNHGVMQNDDEKSLIVEKLADSYLSGSFDVAKEYFSVDSKHFFNDLEYDVDGIVDGYNSHSLIFNDIKHNDRKIYTGYFSDGSIQTYHDFNWSATSKLSGEEYYYPCHCRWVWEADKMIKTNCYVDPTGIFTEAALFQENVQ